MRKGLLFVFLLISINIFAFDCLNWSIKIEGDSVCCLKQEKVLSVVISDLSPADSCLYIWQELKGGQYITISEFSGDSLVLENVESGTFCYRCIAKPNECVQDTSEIFKLIVRPDITAAEIVGQEDSICYDTVPQMFSVKIAPTCAEDDSIIYQWEESVDSIEWNSIDGATTDSYQPGALVSDRYYRLRTTSVQGCGYRFSNVIKVCVYKDLEITTQGVSPLCCMKQEEIRVSATGQGGLYTYQWYYSGNNIDFVEIEGATSATYRTESKTEGTYYYKCVVTLEKGCLSKESAVIEVEVYEDLTSGLIQGTDTICYNAVPRKLSQKAEPTGGDGVYRYQWQKREKGSDIWQDIPSATNKTYQPTPLIITTDYRLGVIDECKTVYTDSVRITVRPDITAAEIEGEEDSICYDTVPQMFSVKVFPTCAEDDSLTYQWEESIDSIEWNAIDGAVSDKYQPEALVADRYYRLRTTSVQGCGVIYSNVIKVCVYKDLEITTQGVSPLCCMKQEEIRVSATGQGGLYTYQWQYSENNVDFVDISGATSSTYKINGKTEGKYYYKCVVTPVKGCSVKESAVIEVEVYAYLTSGLIQGTDTICYNAVPRKLSQKTEPTGGDGVYRYQWQKREKGSDIWQDIPSATNKTYQPIRLTITTDYRLGVIDECDTVYTDSVRITVRPDITAVEIAGEEDSICYNTEPQMFSVKVFPTCAEDDSLTYQWEESVDSIEWNAIDGAVLDKYQPEALVADRYYRLRTTSVQGCGVIYSNVIKVCVYSDLEITEYSSSLCYMAQGDISVSATGQGGLYTYQWYYSGNNIDFVEIEGATSAAYKTESKTEGTYYYKCKVTPIKGCLEKESDVIAVLVYADVEPATIGIEEQEVCYGEDAVVLNIEQPAIGGDGNYIYLWQKSADKVNWDDLEISSSYLPQKMTETTYYRLKIKTTCKDVYSNIVVVIVNPLPDEQNIKGSSDVCYNQYEYYSIDEIKKGFTYRWSLNTIGGKIVSSDIDVDSIEILWDQANITNEIILEITNEETGCVRINTLSVNVCGEEAPDRTIIVRKPNSDILVAQESAEIYYAWGYTEKTTSESWYIEDSNRRYVLLPHAYDTTKYDYWLRLQPTKESQCYSISYYSPENDEEYIRQENIVTVPTYVKKQVSLQINNADEREVKCSLYTLVGQLIFSKHFGQDTYIDYNIPLLSIRGMYILKVELGSEILTFKLIAE